MRYYAFVISIVAVITDKQLQDDENEYEEFAIFRKEGIFELVFDFSVCNVNYDP